MDDFLGLHVCKAVRAHHGRAQLTSNPTSVFPGQLNLAGRFGGQGMIKSLEQAQEVQHRRAASGKRGYARAVRRYFLRVSPGRYREALGQVSVNWVRNRKPKEAKGDD